MSPGHFSREARQRLLEVHWRQWSSLGVQAQAAPQDRWLVDAEALCVSTRAIGADDRRLLAAAEDWLAVNRSWVHRSRLRRIALAFGKAGLASGQERAVRTGRRRAGAPEVRRPELAQLALRAVFGTDARSDVLLYLSHVGPGSSRAIGLEVGWDQKTVYRILERWVAAGLAAKDPRGYRLTRDADRLLPPAPGGPRYLNWTRTLGALDRLLAGPEAHREEPYAWASLFRDTAPALAAAFDAAGITQPAPAAHPGERYFLPGSAALLRLLAALSDR